MGPMLHAERKRYTAAAAVPFVVLDERVVANVDNDGTISSLCINSFTRAGVSYIITVNGSVMHSCECESFGAFDEIACKLMHLCRRVHPEITFTSRKFTSLRFFTVIIVPGNLEHDIEAHQNLPEEVEDDLAAARGLERISVALEPPAAEVGGIDASSRVQRTINALTAVQRHTGSGHNLLHE